MEDIILGYIRNQVGSASALWHIHDDDKPFQSVNDRRVSQFKFQHNSSWTREKTIEEIGDMLISIASRHNHWFAIDRDGKTIKLYYFFNATQIKATGSSSVHVHVDVWNEDDFAGRVAMNVLDMTSQKKN